MMTTITTDTGKNFGYPLLCLFTGAVAIAFAPIFVRISELDPITTAFYRLLVATPFFLIFALAEGEQKSARPPVQGGVYKDVLLLILGGLFLAGDLALWHLSISMTSVANATLFNNLAPVFVALIGWLFFRERINPSMLTALAIAVAGMAILVGDGFDLGSAKLQGDAVALLTAAFYAGYLTIVKRLRQTMSTSRVMMGTTLAAAVAIVPLMVLEGGPLLPETLAGWAVLVSLGMICHVFGQGLITQALSHLPITFSAIGLLLQPVAAAILAWVLFGEALGTPQWIGGGFVLIGITLARFTATDGRS